MQIIPTAINARLLVFVTCCTLQLSCFAITIKSHGDFEHLLWAKERQMRSLLDAGGKTISDSVQRNFRSYNACYFWRICNKNVI